MINQKLAIILLRYPWIGYAIVGTSMVILNMIFNLNTTSCAWSDAADVKDTISALNNNQENTARHILAMLSTVTDPIHRANIRQILLQYANQIPEGYMIDTETLTLSNAGNIPPTYEPTWRNVLYTLTLATVITVIGYVIIRNWDTVRDLVFDTAMHITQLTLLQHFELVRHNPDAVRDVANYMIVNGLMRGPHAAGG